ncbi:MAG TPA: hypothetical protein PLP14_11140, partial [Chitinophagaceae bacterium]|nr:hypothetical protein [Chitinophagaceae bacterium]
ENSYLYVFSMKPDGSTELLFPKAGNEYDERDMPIMTSGKVKVIIPEHPDRAFTTNQAGTDYLCILICKQRVENMLHQLKQIEQAHGELPDRIRQVFEHEVVAEEDVLYSNRRMKGEVRKSKGQILPIILKVDVQE